MSDLVDLIEKLRVELCDLLAKYREKIPINLLKLWEMWEDQFHELLDEMKEDLTKT
ncbi:MAG: hypothetical protein QXO15_03335 [Nitrososphaerota archaeon]